MRTIIFGSRIIKGASGMIHLMDAIQACPFQITEVISGNAEGVDTLADAWAKQAGIDRVIFPGNWKGKGRSAGYKRNQKMAWYAALFDKEYAEKEEECPSKLQGACLGIWDGASVGSKHMMDIATDKGLPLYVHLVKDIVKKKPGRKANLPQMNL